MKPYKGQRKRPSYDVSVEEVVVGGTPPRGLRLKRPPPRCRGARAVVAPVSVPASQAYAPPRRPRSRRRCPAR